VKASTMPGFPFWLQNRSAVCQEAEELWSELPTENDSSQAQKALAELITNPLMKLVWDELYRNDRKNPGEFMNPARLTNKSQAAAYRGAAIELREKGNEKNSEDANWLEFEARVIESVSEEWVYSDLSEQDCAARFLFSRVYRIALDHEPVILADVQAKTKQLRNIAGRLRSIAQQQLRATATDLASVGEILGRYHEQKLEVDAYTTKLDQIADDCLQDAIVMQPVAGDLGIIVRKRGDIPLRTIVGKLAKVTYALFMKPLYGTIANLTNVICAIEQIKLGLDRDEAKIVTREDVIEMLGNYPPELRPSFGPLLEPALRQRFEAHQLAVKEKDRAK
jgi:hypothetical protein